MEFKKITLKQSINIESIVSLHYFEYTKGFSFSGEMHDFWEFVYADRHQLHITAGSEELVLDKGELYLHRPMEFHNLRCAEESVANSVIVSFVCDCPELFLVAGRKIKCDDETRQYMANIISETASSFSNYLGDPYNNTLIRKQEQPFGSEQLIKLNIESLLIKLIRTASKDDLIKPQMQLRTNEKLFIQICEYLQSHCRERITFEQICKEFNLSSSKLKRLFNSLMDCGVMEYFGRCKIDAAKELIRQNNLNFSSISNELGYSSVQYFSRHFKVITGMTPSQYATSVKSVMSQEPYN